MTGADPLYRISDLIHVYRELAVETIALRGIDLEIGAGELLVVMGRSGSGKSTLLNLMAGNDQPTAGRILFRTVDLARATEPERARLRGREIGVIHQSRNLIPILSLAENVQLAAVLADAPASPDVVRGWLNRLGLADRATHRPAQLSGGEQQRGAIACVLAGGPAVLLGDEITGELDSATAARVVETVREANQQLGTTIVLTTHDPLVAGLADRVIHLAGGRITRIDRAAA